MKQLFIYNTLTRKKEEFLPLNPPRVGLYTCGPTVYNYAHIGNFRAYVFEDLLRRLLEVLGYDVHHVMNITDVGHLVSDADTGEDKVEAGARREGKTASEIARFYAGAFFKDSRKLNLLKPRTVPKATEHIPEMISLVKSLEEKGFTYRISDGIYFDTSKFDGYARLMGKSHMDGLKAGARVEANPEKRNPSDFALWKFSPPGARRQMEWDSPWGRGFPGWHIECSAMSMKYLGETFDVHCGGVDHIPVHHTNEIAQSEAATGKKFVRFWLHNEFLIMSGEAKMAKSAGEFLTLDRLVDRGWDPLVFRYLVCSAHYRTQIEFSWEAMEFASRSLSTLLENARRFREDMGNGATPGAGGEKYWDSFLGAMCDDLNSSKALGIIWDGVRDEKIPSSEKLWFLKQADRILGLGLATPREEEPLPPEIMRLIDEREEARKNRDFARSDAIRKDLAGKGIVVSDTPRGPRWKKGARH